MKIPMCRFTAPACVAIALYMVILSSACTGAPTPRQEFEKYRQWPSKQLRNYTFDPTSTLAARVVTIPGVLLDDVKKLDKRDDYRVYALAAGERKMVEQYLELLPPRHRKVLRERLIGIYFVSPFLGSGLTDWVLDDAGKIYAILIVNPEVFRKDMSGWLTYREKTCFRDDGSVVGIEVDAGTRYTGLMYILLHESTHILDFIENHTPYVEPPLAHLATRGPGDCDFTRGIWKELSIPAEGARFPMRGEVTFYGMNGGPKIPLAKAAELYRGFVASPFVSLYGSQSWAEDFAEMAMAYHLVKKLGQPFTVRVTKDGRELFRYSPMDSERVKARAAYLEKLY